MDDTDIVGEPPRPNLWSSLLELPPKVFIFTSLVVGAVASGAAHIVFSEAYDHFVIQALPPAQLERLLTYGVTWGMCMVLVVAVGASAPLVAVAVRFKRAWPALIVPAGVSLLVAWSAFALWEDNFAENGPQPTDAICFVPPIVASGVGMLLVVVGGAIRLVRRGHGR